MDFSYFFPGLEDLAPTTTDLLSCALDLTFALRPGPHFPQTDPDPVTSLEEDMPDLPSILDLEDLLSSDNSTIEILPPDLGLEDLAPSTTAFQSCAPDLTFPLRPGLHLPPTPDPSPEEEMPDLSGILDLEDLLSSDNPNIEILPPSTSKRRPRLLVDGFVYHEKRQYLDFLLRTQPPSIINHGSPQTDDPIQSGEQCKKEVQERQHNRSTSLQRI